ncbi:MAG: TauD/TfdA family dioxygenase [Acidimicrobiales bacterium]
MSTTQTPATAGEPQRQAALGRARIKQRGAAPLGPHTHLAEKREALAALRWERFAVTPLSPTIGAEIEGVDLGTPLDDATVAELRRALLAHKVLVFRDQDLDTHHQVAFARRFGELEIHPFLAGAPDAPELVRLAKDATVGGYENVWHSDVSWRERPALGAVLRAVEVPDVGGDTLFADMAAAYQGLDDRVRRRIEGMVAVHDFTLSFGQALSAEDRAAALEQHPPVEHPVVRTHPETGESILYVNAIFTSHVVGLPEDESEDLLDQLFRQAEVPEHQVRLRWRPGTVAFWDNRATQHYAASDYWPQRRVMERAAIAGDRPS